MADFRSITEPLLRLRYGKLPIAAGTCFIHLPKTGGASLSEFLFGADLGHFRVARLAPALGEGRVLTILRPPVQRFFSAAIFLRHATTYEADQKLRNHLAAQSPAEALDLLLNGIGTSKHGIHFRGLAYFLGTQGSFFPRIDYIEFSELESLTRSLQLPRLNQHPPRDPEREVFFNYLRENEARIGTALGAEVDEYEKLRQQSTHLDSAMQVQRLKGMRDDAGHRPVGG